MYYGADFFYQKMVVRSWILLANEAKAERLGWQANFRVGKPTTMLLQQSEIVII